MRKNGHLTRSDQSMEETDYSWPARRRLSRSKPYKIGGTALKTVPWTTIIAALSEEALEGC